MEVDDSMPSSTTPSSSTAGGTATAHDFDNDDKGLFPNAGTSTDAAGAADSGHLAGPETPQNDHLNAAAPGELSPPRSQSVAHGASTTAPAPQAVSNGGHLIDDLTIDGGAVGGGGAGGATGAGAGAGGEDGPGAGWKNKKAQDEKSRALEWTVDRDFTLEPFGDVVLLGKQQHGEA